MLYTGKDNSLDITDARMTHAVDPIPHRGHHVYMHTSPQLFKDLRVAGFGACGTLRLNRRGLPRAVHDPMKEGEKKAIQVDPSMLAVKWYDKREVTTFTTIHNGSSPKFRGAAGV